MNNTTNSTSDYTKRIDWIIPITTNIILTIVTSYMLVSITYYGIRTSKWRRTHRSNHEKLNAGAVYFSVVLCAAMCIFRYTASMVAMNTGFGSDKDLICDRFADLAYCAYSLVLFSVAILLWFRQRTFFVNKMLNVSYKLWIRMLSSASIFFIIGLWIFVITYNIIPITYRSSHQGCIYQPDKNVQAIYWLIAVAGIVLAHFALVGLFSYAILRIKRSVPLGKNYKQRVSTVSIVSSHEYNGEITQTELVSVANTIEYRSKEPSALTKKLKTTAKKRKSNPHKIRSILTKTLIFAILSILCDVFIQVFAHYIIDPNGHRRLSHMIFDINSFLSLLFLVFSFDSAKQMLSMASYFR